MKRRDEVLVGVFLSAAVAIALLGTLWLVRGGLSSGYPLYTKFAWGQNLKPGQQVLLAGVNVGAVSDVKLSPAAFMPGDTGTVTITLANPARSLAGDTTSTSDSFIKFLLVFFSGGNGSRIKRIVIRSHCMRSAVIVGKGNLVAFLYL
jgi:ABC-type transporter Mla subunit MlaD